MDNNEREYLLNRASDLRKMANDLEAIAYGKLDPHGDKIGTTVARAKTLIRYLVEDWL
jgi:hypothetical protein